MDPGWPPETSIAPLFTKGKSMLLSPVIRAASCAGLLELTMPASLLTMPQGGQFMDWRCPRWWDVLMHADRGFFVWTPVMGIAIASLVVFAGDWGALGMGAVVVFILTVYVNGSVTDWAGADSFGSRRFDLVVPLAALGLASLVVHADPPRSRTADVAPRKTAAGRLRRVEPTEVPITGALRAGRRPSQRRHRERHLDSV